MHVTVRLRREAGEFRPPHERGGQATGEMFTHRIDVDGRQVLMLTVAGEPRVQLFEPRLIGLLHDELQFIGYERVGRAWMLQQWDCKILGVQQMP